MKHGADSNQRPGRITWRLPAWLSRLLLWTGIILCGFLLYDLTREHSLRIALGPLPILLIFALSIASLITASAAWSRHFFALSGIKLDWMTAMRQLSMVLLGKYVPGKVSGIAARILENRDVASTRVVLGATAAEQTGSLLAAMTIGISAWLVHEHPMLSVPTFVALAVMLTLVTPRVAEPLLTRLSGAALVNARAIRWALACQTASWVFLGGIVIIVANMIGGDSPTGITMYVVAAYSAAVVAGQIAFVFPGGIGPREGVFAWLLTDHVSPADALAIATTMRIVTTAIDLLSSAAYLLPIRASLPKPFERNQKHD